MQFEILVGDDAQRWFDDAGNVRDWRQLEAHCPWAGEYQSSEFASTWYRHYGSEWAPLLVLSRGAGGELSGALPLASRGRTVVGAGAAQGEYQGFLCHPGRIAAFLDGAVAQVLGDRPGSRLHLRYVDPGDDSAEFVAWARGRADAILEEHPRPLMQLDAAAADESLRKRSTRSKHNRLRRAGEFEFRSDRLETGTEAALDDIIRLYDFRQGAANDSCPFADDDRKRAFHLDLLRNAPGFFVAFRILLDGRTAAALLAVNGPGFVSNAIFTYAPEIARHSPGKILIYLAMQELAGTSRPVIDLTPGGDPWKERFATRHDHVYELSVWSSPWGARRAKLGSGTVSVAAAAIRRIGIAPADVKSGLSRLARIRPRHFWQPFARLLPSRVEYRVYRMDLSKPGEAMQEGSDSTETHMREGALSDLVRYAADAGWLDRQAFLFEAMVRLERGERVYSVADDDTLLHYGWLVEEQDKSYFTEVGAEYDYPEPGSVLYDFYTHPGARGRGLYQKAIRQMLRDRARCHADGRGPGIVYISVLADNAASRHVIEKLGFEYVESIVRTSGYGRSRCERAVCRT